MREEEEVRVRDGTARERVWDTNTEADGVRRKEEERVKGGVYDKEGGRGRDKETIGDEERLWDTEEGVREEKEVE
jgi:hypothetical protein